MKTPRLEWFITVAETGSISKTADILFISQQSLSSYIKRLESHYSIVLFDRSKSFSLTPQGKALYDYSKRVLKRETELLEKYQEIHSGDAGRIRFGLSAARSQNLLPKVIPLFHEQYPNVMVPTTEMPTASLVKLLAQRDIDIYYGKDFDTPRGVEKEILLHEHLYLIITTRSLQRIYGTDASNIIARFQNGVWLQELTKFPFVGIDPTGKLDRPIDAYCHKQGIVLNNVVQANSTPLLIELCLKNLGAGLCLEAFLPQVLQSSLEHPDNRLNVFPVLDDITDWQVVLAYYPSDREPAYSARFKSLIRNYARQAKG